MAKIEKALLTINVNRVHNDLEIVKLGHGILVVEHPFLPKTIFSKFPQGGATYIAQSFLGFTKDKKYKYKINRQDQQISSIDKPFLTKGDLLYRRGGPAWLAPAGHASTTNIERFDHELFNTEE